MSILIGVLVIPLIYFLSVMIYAFWNLRELNDLRQQNREIGNRLRSFPIVGRDPISASRELDRIDAELANLRAQSDAITPRRLFTLGTWT